MSVSVPPRTFPRALLARDTLAAARSLLGTLLVRDADPPGAAAGRRIGRIVEVEAYLGEADLASHARFGRTGRSDVMYGDPGLAYVYLVYGMYHCLNVVTEAGGRPAAVLVRAVEPIGGMAIMRAARVAFVSGARRDPAAPEREARRVARLRDARLAAGPGLVAAAFSLDRGQTGLDLCDPRSPVRLELPESGWPIPEVVATRRVGIDYAGEPWSSAPWRFLVRGSPAVSVPGGRVRGGPLPGVAADGDRPGRRRGPGRPVRT